MTEIRRGELSDCHSKFNNVLIEFSFYVLKIYVPRDQLHCIIRILFSLCYSTFQVSDYDMQQCRSVAVHIATKPELRLDPPSATVYRGESLRIRCLSSDSDQGYGTLGYSWTKNNALFQSDADAELWEDLYPDGSILKIYNMQVIYIH